MTEKEIIDSIEKIENEINILLTKAFQAGLQIEIEDLTFPSLFNDKIPMKSLSIKVSKILKG